MAVESITPLELTKDTASADSPDASATAITTGADGFSVVADSIGRGRNVLMKFVETGGNAGVVVLEAGDKPPSITAGLGDLSITMAANDVKYISVEQARFLHDDGTYKGTVTGAAADTMALEVIVTPADV
jgi:hypothetical protein